MDILNKIMDFIGDKLAYVMNLFPVSPFKSYIDYFKQLPYMGYINWFIPIDVIVDVTVAWCTVIAIYYLYSVVARWVKAIE